MYRLTAAKAPAQREPKSAGQESEAEPKHSAPDLNVKRGRRKLVAWNSSQGHRPGHLKTSQELTFKSYAWHEHHTI